MTIKAELIKGKYYWFVKCEYGAFKLSYTDSLTINQKLIDLITNEK